MFPVFTVTLVSLLSYGLSFNKYTFHGGLGRLLEAQLFYCLICSYNFFSANSSQPLVYDFLCMTFLTWGLYFDKYTFQRGRSRLQEAQLLDSPFPSLRFQRNFGRTKKIAEKRNGQISLFDTHLGDSRLEKHHYTMVQNIQESRC